jgi:hypothetical protein
MFKHCSPYFLGYTGNFVLICYLKGESFNIASSMTFATVVFVNGLLMLSNFLHFKPTDILLNYFYTIHYFHKFYTTVVNSTDWFLKVNMVLHFCNKVNVLGHYHLYIVGFSLGSICLRFFYLCSWVNGLFFKKIFLSFYVLE